MPATSGVDFLIQVNTGTEAVPVWTTVGGQRGATLNRSTDVIDTTNKASGGWEENILSIRHWGIDFDGLLIEDDAAYAALEDAYNTNTLVMVQLTTAAGNKYSGKASLVDFPTEMPYDGETTYSGSLQGTGPLTKTPAA